LYAEASGNNVRIVTQGGVITPAITFTALEQMLPASTFVRIHRSFIINKDKIGSIEGNRVFVGGSELPIGVSYRELFLRTLGMK
jgi:DNA-binding LytR/AlgR family response regulator